MNDQPETTENELIDQVRIGEALIKLKGNPDFKLVIEQSYMRDGLMKRSSGVLSENVEVRNRSASEIAAIHLLIEHLDSIENIAYSAMEELEN